MKRKKSILEKRLKKMKLKRIENVNILGYNMEFTYEFFGKDKTRYMILWEIYGEEIIIGVINTQTKNKLGGVHLISDTINGYRHLKDIDTKIFQNRGIGTAMMITFFDIVITKTPDVEIIYGSINSLIGDGNAKKFYNSFDGEIIHNKTIYCEFITFSEHDKLVYKLK